MKSLQPLLPIFAAVALVLQPQATLSALLALACVALPQQIAFFAMRRHVGAFRFGVMFKLWGLKFTLTLLFLVLALKGLAASGWLTSNLTVAFFVIGAATGLLLNILLTARLTPVTIKAKD